MPILEADIKGKKGREDVLTSRVFGTLEIAERASVLGNILKGLGIDVVSEELEKAKFRYWEKYDERDIREPDVIIQADKILIFGSSDLSSMEIREGFLSPLVQLWEGDMDSSYHQDGIHGYIQDRF